MVREDILAGLRSAVAKNESLKQAMISFYNAGYKREDIQEAGRVLQEEQLTLGIQQPPLTQQPSVQQQPVQTQPPQQFVQQPVQQMQPGRPVQIVSGYAPQKKTGKTLIILLVVVLVFLIGFLSTIFIFRYKLADILGGLI